MARGVNSPSEDSDAERNGTPPSSSVPSDVNSRRNGLTLPLNSLAIPLISPSQSREDVQEGGQILFQNYLREEFEHQGVQNPPFEHLLYGAGDATDHAANQQNGAGTSTRYRGTELYAGIRFSAESASAASTPQGYKTLDWTKMGRNIRDIADQFAQSKEGAQVRRTAQEVELGDITENRFIDLLIGLFSDGFTAERVAALFYFCTTLIIRAACQNRAEITRFLFTWSLKYIRDRVCQWVYEHGGWENVLSSIIYPVVLKSALIVLCVVGIVAGFVYIRKNW